MKDFSSAAAIAAKQSSLRFNQMVLQDIRERAVTTNGQFSATAIDIFAHDSSTTAVHLSADGLRLQHPVDCSSIQGCSFTSSKLEVLAVRCSPSSGSLKGNMSIACEPCLEGTVQLDESGQGPCKPCPANAKICQVDKLELHPGVMVEMNDVSNALHCPNPGACPGGDASKPLCKEGHRGPGCADCIKGYGLSDSSVLVCTRCDYGLLQWVKLLVKSTVLFGIGVASVLKASHDVKFSGVLLNQLLSFGTVAATILAAAMQTLSSANAFDSLFAVVAANVADVSSGATGSSSQSLQCMLGDLGMTPSIYNAHLLSGLFPALLAGGYACKNYKIALLVGINIFFPDFFAYFGKYLVCYRFTGEGVHDTYGVQCPFLPYADNSRLAYLLVVVAAAALLGFVLKVWLYLCRHEPTGNDDLPPPHVIFITKAYKKDYLLWETERLLRKSLLKFSSTALPVTYSPASQMACVALVLLGSGFSYAILMPYRESKWNYTEIILVCSASIMTCLTTCLLSNEAHWGRTEPVQYALLITIALLAGGICIGMACKFVVEVLRERRILIVQEEKDAESQGDSLPSPAQNQSGRGLPATIVTSHLGQPACQCAGSCSHGMGWAVGCRAAAYGAADQRLLSVGKAAS